MTNVYIGPIVVATADLKKGTNTLGMDSARR